MRQFAKLYETEVGQILVKQDEGEEGPEVRLYFTPKNLGVCSIGLTWKEHEIDAQYEKSDAAFKAMTRETAINLVSDAINTLAKAY